MSTQNSSLLARRARQPVPNQLSRGNWRYSAIRAFLAFVDAAAVPVPAVTITTLAGVAAAGVATMPTVNLLAFLQDAPAKVEAKSFYPPVPAWATGTPLPALSFSADGGLTAAYAAAPQSVEEPLVNVAGGGSTGILTPASVAPVERRDLQAVTGQTVTNGLNVGGYPIQVNPAYLGLFTAVGGGTEALEFSLALDIDARSGVIEGESSEIWTETDADSGIITSYAAQPIFLRESDYTAAIQAADNIVEILDPAGPSVQRGYVVGLYSIT